MLKQRVVKHLKITLRIATEEPIHIKFFIHQFIYRFPIGWCIRKKHSDFLCHNILFILYYILSILSIAHLWLSH